MINTMIRITNESADADVHRVPPPLSVSGRVGASSTPDGPMAKPTDVTSPAIVSGEYTETPGPNDLSGDASLVARARSRNEKKRGNDPSDKDEQHQDHEPAFTDPAHPSEPRPADPSLLRRRTVPPRDHRTAMLAVDTGVVVLVVLSVTIPDR